MREIKFRTWVKKEQKMIYGKQAMAVKMFTPNYAYHDSEVEVMQFTELKDNYGKEIYDGDIVEREVFAFGEQRVFVGQVKNYEGCWWIDTESCAVPLWNEMHLLKVIGNIYENLELLEV